MELIRKGDLILIKFPYNPITKTFVMSLEGRTYVLSEQAWAIPFIGCRKSVEKLQQFGFKFDTSLVLDIAEEEKNRDKLMNLSEQEDVDLESELPLYPFQKVAVKFMVEAGSCLNAYGVGTGKSLMAISAIRDLGTDRNLIVCPKSLIFQWAKEELQKWDRDAKVFIVYGNKTERIKIYEEARNYKTGRFYLIVGYETARSDFEELQKF